MSKEPDQLANLSKYKLLKLGLFLQIQGQFLHNLPNSPKIWLSRKSDEK